MSAVRMIEGRTARRIVLAAALIGALICLCLIARSWREVVWGTVGTYDFVAYWSAARLVARGGNPYDPAALLTVEQQAAGWVASEPQGFWNPPWTLLLMLPLAHLPFGTAVMIWLAVDFVLVLVSGLLLWDYFTPKGGGHWVGMLLSIVFCPTLLALWMGQISPWMLAGVVAFLSAEQRKRDLVAGASLALLMIKPHVAYLFWLAALWWAWRVGRWRVLIGWLVALVGASGMVVLMAPDAFANYLAAVRNPPLGWHSATIGTWLRELLGWELSWLQFVPPLLGGLGLLAWLRRRREPWRWEKLAGPLLLASVVTTAYGYSFDQVVLLPVVMALVGAVGSRPSLECVAILVALAASQVALWAVNHWGIPDAFNVWHAPTFTVLYWWSVGRHQAFVNSTGHPPLSADATGGGNRDGRCGAESGLA